MELLMDSEYPIINNAALPPKTFRRDDRYLNKKFGRLTPIKREAGYGMYLCLCDCGNTKIVRGADMRLGRSKSCGCLRDEYHERMKKPKRRTIERNSNYPWNETKIGRKFTVVKSYVTKRHLQVHTATTSRRLNKKFLVIDKPGEFYEIKRIK